MKRMPVNKYVNFKINSLVNRHKNHSVSIVCERDGYLDHDGYNLYVVSELGVDWFDHAKHKKTAFKKRDWALSYLS